MSTNYNFDKFASDVNGNLGFSISELSLEDLKIFKDIVTQQYDEVMIAHVGSKENEFSIHNYHKSHAGSSQLHKKMWPKHNRILSKARLEILLQTQFFKELKSHFNWWEITDEENIGFGEVYFRLCRPTPYKDVGPLHADAWFWELGHGEMPKVGFDTQRVKFWFCLETSESITGFRYVPGSHLKSFDYGGELRDGFVKPTFDEDEHDFNTKSLNGMPGKFIVFNDQLLHGGEVLNTGTRVSLEFTLVIPQQAA